MAWISNAWRWPEIWTLLQFYKLKTAAVLIEDGAFAPFYCPHCKAFAAHVSQPPGNDTQGEKMLMPEG